MNLYSIFDTRENKMIAEGASYTEVAEKLGVSGGHVHKCLREDTLISGRYKISKPNASLIYKESRDSEIKKVLDEWDSVRTPFLKVKWVQNHGPGVKVLNSSRS